jgi:hypothetical protein
VASLCHAADDAVLGHALQGKMLLPGVADQEADVEAHRVWKCAFAPPGNNRAANLMVQSGDVLQGTPPCSWRT